MSAFISEQPNRARLFDERRNDGASVRGEERSRKRYAVRDDEVCIPYKRESECTKLNRLIPKKVGSKSERCECIYKRTAEPSETF